MKKILISCFALMLLLGYTQGQEKYDPRSNSRDPAVSGAFLKEQYENIKNNAEFVFEGFIQRSDIYPRKDKDGKIYYPVCDIVKITKVFRGNLKPGTVELAGVKGNAFACPSERVSYIPDSRRYIFFCRAAGKDHPYDSKYDIYPVDNKTILMRDDQIVNSTFMLAGDNVFGTMMHEKGDIYRYIRKLPNIKMPKLTKEDTVYVNPWKAVPAESRMSQVEVDSIMNIRLAKRRLVLHRADSIRRVKADSIGRIKSDSIALVKKKVQLAVIPKVAVAI